jgi:hypothetical protein
MRRRTASPPAQPQAQPLVPFVAAAHEHHEPGPVWTAIQPGAASIPLGPIDVPAFGYIRSVLLELTTTGAGTGGTGNADFPFSFFQNVTLQDVNGAPLCNLSGYQLLWANIVGGYAYASDPRKSPWYSTSVTAPAFFLRVPVEINHYNGLGCLANQSAAAAYKLSVTINPSASIYSVAPTTNPTVQIRTWLEAWTLPNATDMLGRRQAQAPPAHGTAQYLTVAVRPVVAGMNTILFPRVGNLLRFLVLISRDGTGARSVNAFPAAPQLLWDARLLFNEDQNVRSQLGYERLENLSALDTGVWVYTFAHSNQGRSGDGPPNLWLPTVQSSRLELDGTAANAGNLEVVTNDVSVAETVPAERYVETSATGHHPDVGISNPVSQ